MDGDVFGHFAFVCANLSPSLLGFCRIEFSCEASVLLCLVTQHARVTVVNLDVAQAVIVSFVLRRAGPTEFEAQTPFRRA